MAPFFSMMLLHIYTFCTALHGTHTVLSLTYLYPFCYPSSTLYLHFSHTCLSARPPHTHIRLIQFGLHSCLNSQLCSISFHRTFPHLLFKPNFMVPFPTCKQLLPFFTFWDNDQFLLLTAGQFPCGFFPTPPHTHTPHLPPRTGSTVGCFCFAPSRLPDGDGNLLSLSVYSFMDSRLTSHCTPYAISLFLQHHSISDWGFSLCTFSFFQTKTGTVRPCSYSKHQSKRFPPPTAQC